MPRKPTTEVIEHRITLGTYERKIVDDVASSYSFKSIADPIIRFVNDDTSLLLIFAALGLFLDSRLEGGWRDIVPNLSGSDLSDWLETQNIAGATVGALFGGLFGGPFGAILGGIGGTVGVELAESLQSTPEERAGAADYYADLAGTVVETPTVTAGVSIALGAWKTLKDMDL